MSRQSYTKSQPMNIPQTLRDRPQWANWHHDKVIRNSRTGRNGSSTDIKTWSTFAQALKRDPDRLVFIFDRMNGLVGLDVDGCRNAETGEIDARGRALIEHFPHIYWEISLSGTGLHGIGRGVLPAETSGKHPKGIGVFHHSRYFVMTGNVLPGHETLGDFGDGLADWYRELFPPEPQRPASPPPTLTMDDHDIIDRLINEQNGKARQLLAGDITGYPDYSSARFALANKLCFYTNDTDLIERIVRSSGLFKDADRDRDRDRKARLEATKVVSEYVGPRYDPAYHGTSAVPPSPGPQEIPQGATCEAHLAAVRAELAQAKALIAQQAEQIRTLQERVRLSDEREAIQRNAKLGAPRQTAAALATLFREERPKEPGTPTPYRMPLAKLAERTGLSADACSRQLKKLAEYRTPSGDRVLYTDTREVPRSVNQETGEITEPHREIWVGPGDDPSAFGYVLAQLAPADAPKHGGKPDRNVCPEHPNAGVLRRTRTMRRITHECAHCQKILDTQVVPVGRESIEHLRSMAAPPDPIQHDAFAPETDEPATGGPMPQHAASMDTHSGERDLSGKMRHSPQSQSGYRPPPSWEDDHRRMYGQVYRGETAS